MHFARFRSSPPCDHMPRMLDTLRRMGFEVHRVVMDSIDSDLSSIEVVYRTAGHLDPATFVARLQVMPGVCDVTAGKAPDGGWARRPVPTVERDGARTGELAGCMA
ncbi:hypothetical protein [Microbaculum marinum]|uniref:Uncharacterized protein n=1 Tax=Microbaculum marinum TaxID=1764581 RepID=A0AAW9RJX3_9HYPH